MSYQDSLVALTADVQARLASWLARDDLDTDELRAVMATIVARGRVQAAGLADAAVAAELSRLWGRFVPALGLSDDDPQEAAEKAVSEALVSDGWKLDAAVAAGVLGRSQVMETAQFAYQAGMQDHGVEYWTRDVEPGACEICQDLTAGILPMSQAPWFHKGCGCTQKPIEPGKEY